MLHFHIVLETGYKHLCLYMNSLQAQAFEINKDVLDFINKNYDFLVKSGLLMPRFLASLNIPNAINKLRNSYLEAQSISQVCNYQELLREFMVRIQRACYETFIINLASAYEGYRFYLPAFLDFRGRIYRAGILHFHERDLARSLILFSNTSTQLDSEKEKNEVYKVLRSAAGFHYKKFDSYDDAHQWYLDQQNLINESDESLIQFALDASDPYQFISKVLCIEGKTDPTKIPITQDASASAYQIMSFLLLDRRIATLTNLIPDIENDEHKIRDIYIYILEKLKDYLSSILKDDMYSIFCSRLTRKLVKQLFMPLIYGKTIISMSNDIYNHYSTIIGKKECMMLASHIYDFFKKLFPNIINLMNIVRDVGWISAASDKPVFYSVPVLTTVQDYMKFKNVNIWVYDCSKKKNDRKKKRQVTLRIPTEDRDRRKTHTSTFANFIHQKDAYIAMFMICEILDLGAPLYTVHDNFITTAPYAMRIPKSYLNVFLTGPDPLSYINGYLTRNLLDGNACPYTSGRPLPIDYLYDILEYKMPKNLSNTKKIIWSNKIKSIVECYTIYLITSCGYDVDNIECNYNGKFESFKRNIRYWDYIKYNYSLHL